jgi:tetratricopeptide (TPR) repeat protein
MLITKRIVSLSIVFSLSSCAGVGVVDSSNPLTKLVDAEFLFMNKNRPVPAETLILEAMAAYQKLDDPHGLGSANREYGDFLRSQAVVNWERAYSRHGFFDRTVTYENRLEKAKEHYSKALEYYRVAETQELAAGKYDALTNLYYNMAWSNLALGARDEACVDYDRTLQAYNDNMQQNPTAHPRSSPLGTIPEGIAAAKKRADCKEAAT